ncbi:serine subtilase [Cryptosporidium ubiquitum]|uniref:subtilisin n=1 Tax=Cryptosporidium ubiquitum TaxID=857276 RepID=A0A1J4MD40_9CRYT|nr:serine subtilase [Cryptosporidium ubiquitum]OII71895.1 serine subtilase [Cryptosporidium ubiquitum]
MRAKLLIIQIVVILIITVRSQNLIRIENGVELVSKKQESNLGNRLTVLIKKIKEVNEPQYEESNRIIFVYKDNNGSNELFSRLRLRFKNIIERAFNILKLNMEIIQTKDNDQMTKFLGVIKDQVSLFQDLIQGVYLDEFIGFEENNYRNTFEIPRINNSLRPTIASDNYSAIYQRQWFHNDSRFGIKSGKMWKRVSELKDQGMGNVVIAVIDSGIDFEHPDLRGKIWRNFGEFDCNDGIDDDMNGYVDDCYGWNFVDNNKIPLDNNGHGTHISGIISAIPNTEVGITGICWFCQIMVLKVLDSKIRGFLSGFVEAIDYALDKGVKISNHSYGSRSIELLRLAIKRSEDQGMLVIVASGNYESDRNNDIVPTFPSSFKSENIISVTSITSNGELMERATYGRKTVHIGAPGVNICSTYLQGEYRCMDGSSFSAPIITGIAGVLLSVFPNISIYSIKDCILKSATRIRGLPDNVRERLILRLGITRNDGERRMHTSRHNHSITHGSSCSSGDSADEVLEREDFSFKLLDLSQNDSSRVKYLGKLSYLKIWIPSAHRPPKHQTAIIFDWDDTLLCTTFLNEQVPKKQQMNISSNSQGSLNASAQGLLEKDIMVSQKESFNNSQFLLLPENIQNIMNQIQRCVKELLLKAMDMGNVFLITNASEGWVDYSAKMYMPEVVDVLSRLTIISARSKYEHKYPGAYHKWKFNAFLEIQKKLDSETITNLISIGDSIIEMEAVHILGREFSESLVKTIKMKESPTPDELFKQLSLINAKFENICLNARNLKIVLEKRSL